MEFKIDGAMYEEVGNKGIYHCDGCVAVGDSVLCDMLSLSTGSTCCSGSGVSVIWKIKEVKNLLNLKKRKLLCKRKKLIKVRNTKLSAVFL